MKHSIRVRLLLAVVAILAPVIAAAGWVLLQTFGQRLQRDVNIALTEEAETIAEVVASHGSSGALTDLVAHVAGNPDLGEQKYVVVERDGDVLAQAPAGAQSVLGRADAGVHIVRYTAPASAVVVTIGVQEVGARSATERLRSLLLVGVPLLIALAAAGLWLTIGGVMRPLETAATALSEIDLAHLSEGLPVESPDDEVGRLIGALNSTLGHVETAMSELRRFTGDAAHALRTPLTVQRTGLEVALSQDRPAAEYRQALNEALISAEQMSRIAERLLTLARLDAAEAPRELGTVDIGEMLHELADAFAAAAGERHAVIEVDASANACVRGDPADLYRLFSDLIDNALRYGRHQDPTTPSSVVVSAHDKGDRVEITVADRGPGIDPAELQHVFKRFYRGRAQHSDDGGTGLGLSIAEQIVRAHGGQIDVGNRAGGGCLVTVRFPHSCPRSD